jgi:putative endonuclease
LSQTHRQRIGKWGEDAAAGFLERQGYCILARNVHTAYGEIDLIARQPDGDLVFVEVKTRTNSKFGLPEEAVDFRKMAHLISSAQAYLLEKSSEPDEHWQIDVIAIQGRPGQNDDDIRFEHFQNIAT